MLKRNPIVLLGGPDSGKTNYVARIWESLRSGQGTLVSPQMPVDIKYVESALEHLLRGQFAPRSDTNYLDSDQRLTVPVLMRDERDGEMFELVVPDVSGELWKAAVETCELPQQRMNDLQAAIGALLMVRVGSEQNVAPLDWVTATQFLRLHGNDGDNSPERQIPTQVALCELLRFLDHALVRPGSGEKRRVAIVVTAWDRLDEWRASKGPVRYLEEEYPLFAGRLADISSLEVKVFGVSVVGGDFVDESFKEQFLQRQGLQGAGYVVESEAGSIARSNDLTLPISWVVDRVRASR
jgi:hypothetical protein